MTNTYIHNNADNDIDKDDESNNDNDDDVERMNE